MLKFLATWRKNRKLKSYRKALKAINAFEPKLKVLTDDELKAKTEFFRASLAQGVPFEQLLPEVFAVVREAAVRTLTLRPFDVQVLGGQALYAGKIVELATGEGKTLTAPFAAYAYFLQNRRVHISTANEFLARRDAFQMHPLYSMLSMSVGVVLGEQAQADKKKAYLCAVTYGTHAEFAQDYLRDRLAKHPVDTVQQPLGVAIVDEADATLIDDARTPITISAGREVSTLHYQAIDRIACSLVRAEEEDSGDFHIDGKLRTAVLSDAGYDRVTEQLRNEGLLSAQEDLYAGAHQRLLHQITQALNARYVLLRDHHYVVQGDCLVLVDELTGRLLPGRRWDSGLQQALQTKEGLPISLEEVVLASITLQHYFLRYSVLAGMTGTAALEAEEFRDVYGLDVVEVPPNTPSCRLDADDRIFRTEPDKLAAVLEEIAVRHAKGQPVLVGTTSIEQSEALSAALGERQLPHNVLNARQHAREAEILAQAGMPGAITVSTNMAGRGVDIRLGGNVNLDINRERMALGESAWLALGAEGQQRVIDGLKAAQEERAQAVRDAGGLHVLGLERYESRRMDRQLRGRSARQGDPGSTCFYVSLEDPLVANFAGEQVRSLLARLDVKAGDPLEHALLAKAVDGAQRQLEGRAALVRKTLMKYESVLDAQRKAFYAERQDLLVSPEVSDRVRSLVEDEAYRLAGDFAPAHAMPESWDLVGLAEATVSWGICLPVESELRDMASHEIEKLLVDLAMQRHSNLYAGMDEVVRENVLRMHLLTVMDVHWVAHQEELNALKLGIHLRAHVKEDPQHAYKREAYRMFEDLLPVITSGMVTACLIPVRI